MRWMCVVTLSREKAKKKPQSQKAEGPANLTSGPPANGESRASAGWKPALRHRGGRQGFIVRLQEQRSGSRKKRRRTGLKDPALPSQASLPRQASCGGRAATTGVRNDEGRSALRQDAGATTCAPYHGAEALTGRWSQITGRCVEKGRCRAEATALRGNLHTQCVAATNGPSAGRHTAPGLRLCPARALHPFACAQGKLAPLQSRGGQFLARDRARDCHY
jgi:hypothetical protein